MNNIITVLKHIQGKWISQKTTYYVNNRKSSLHISDNEIVMTKKVLNLYHSDNNLHSSYYLNNINLNTDTKTSHLFTQNKNNITLQIINNIISYHGHLYLYSNNCFKKVFTYKSITYVEYTYIITKNFILSIGIIKLKNKYIAVTFTSSIKKIID